MRPVRLLPLLVLSLAAECAGEPPSDDRSGRSGADPDPQLVFWAAMEDLCGLSYAGVVTENVPPDASFLGQELVMHVRDCETGLIRIPFFVGDDRSRTWVISSTAAGMRLKHDHRHEDGSEDAVTQYGGDTAGQGTATVQDFHADAYTADLVPTAATNIWSIEIEPGRLFAYALRREGSDRRFRIEFDLTRPIDTPPGKVSGTSAANPRTKEPL